MRWVFMSTVVISAIESVPLLACTLCAGDFRGRRTIREDIIEADAVVVADLGPAQLINEDGDGRTELVVRAVLKGRSFSPGQRVQVERYLSNPQSNVRRCIFVFRRTQERWELLGVRPLQGEGALAYVNDLVRVVNQGLQPKAEFFVRHLDHPDEDVARDAFTEVARSPDSDIAAAAKSISPQRLRRLLLDPTTPAERRGLIAFLLACAGDSNDLQLIQRLLRDVPADQPGTRRGLLAAHIVLQPREGWQITLRTLADERAGFLERHAAFGVIVFMKNWQAHACRQNVLAGMKSAIVSGDLADLAIEELRRWQWWDLTDVILESYQQPTHDSPIVRRAILRYAVSCPSGAAAKFVETVRRADPDLVKEITDSLTGESNHR